MDLLNSVISSVTDVSLQIENINEIQLQKEKRRYIIALFDSFESFVLFNEVLKRFENGSFGFSGRDINVLEGLADVVNFQIDMIFLPNYGDWGISYENGTATGSQKQLMDNETDLVIGGFSLVYFRTFFLSNSESYLTTARTFVIPSGRAFSALEKLLIPYNFFVWIAFLLCLGIAVIVIITAEQRQSKLRSLIIGNEIKTPFMELLIVIFGSSSHVLPSKNFSRYLLMMFLLFCLVMRTIYQSGLFKFMQSDKRKQGASTINELMEQEYDFYLFEFAFNILDDDSKFMKRAKIIEPSEMFEYYEKTLDPNFKGGVYALLDEIAYYNMKNIKSHTFRVCREPIVTAQLVVLLQKNSYLQEAFDQKLILLKASGLIDHWISDYYNTKYINIKEAKKGAEPLSFKQLIGAFQVWIFGLCLAILTILIEFIFKYKKNVVLCLRKTFCK
ncbi:CLUMA_CG017673, isoform A [Clunio marinus]|uniref:CLUMA_CG017673, isoform A n=1 Tax=Clunio marinus TaxID=568069 RepID=A0A1J1IWL6_9DIPT|nr:CLUMA_CG017673, isoform A [Clunio marinus]